jgi:vacuolar protein sorting-associated protein 11
MKYARLLLEHCPESTTDLFIEYYTGRYKPKGDTELVDHQAPQNGAATTVRNLAALIPLPNISGATTPSVTKVTQDTQDEPPIVYTPPEPRTAFSSFVGHSAQFIIFLEACLKGEGLKQEDSVDLYTTLFEMYLHSANEKKGEEREKWEAKARKLIEDGAVSLASGVSPNTSC